uniref:Uncharacterized protein n=1 Tax=Arundo donax TaxID=35708 RepID=A0A0A8YPW7_ARUDO
MFKRFNETLDLPFYMEIIVSMAWSIWTTRNDWILNGIDPIVQGCRARFKHEFAMVVKICFFFFSFDVS